MNYISDLLQEINIGGQTTKGGIKGAGPAFSAGPAGIDILVHPNGRQVAFRMGATSLWLITSWDTMLLGYFRSYEIVVDAGGDGRIGCCVKG